VNCFASVRAVALFPATPPTVLEQSCASPGAESLSVIAPFGEPGSVRCCSVRQRRLAKDPPVVRPLQLDDSEWLRIDDATDPSTMTSTALMVPLPPAMTVRSMGSPSGYAAQATVRVPHGRTHQYG
jgi:hypothetical protein